MIFTGSIYEYIRIESSFVYIHEKVPLIHSNI